MGFSAMDRTSSVSNILTISISTWLQWLCCLTFAIPTHLCSTGVEPWSFSSGVVRLLILLYFGQSSMNAIQQWRLQSCRLQQCRSQQCRLEQCRLQLCRLPQCRLHLLQPHSGVPSFPGLLINSKILSRLKCLDFRESINEGNVSCFEL